MSSIIQLGVYLEEPIHDKKKGNMFMKREGRTQYEIGRE